MYRYHVIADVCRVLHIVTAITVTRDVLDRGELREGVLPRAESGHFLRHKDMNPVSVTDKLMPFLLSRVHVTTFKPYKRPLQLSDWPYLVGYRAMTMLSLQEFNFHMIPEGPAMSASVAKDCHTLVALSKDNKAQILHDLPPHI